VFVRRRYGVVDGKFCFEGGSRCGRGEGLHVLLSDQAEDIQHTLQLAAQSKLFTRKRPVSRNSSSKFSIFLCKAVAYTSHALKKALFVWPSRKMYVKS